MTLTDKAILWTAYLPEFLETSPFSAMTRGLARVYAKEHRKKHREFRERRRLEPSAFHMPQAAMQEHVHGDEFPQGIGLASYNVLGNVPVHTDPAYAPFVYLYIVRPGPYVVVDSEFDLTPQLAGTLICFNGHEHHALFNRKDTPQFLMSSHEQKSFVYDHMPSKAWVAFTFDSMEEMDVDTARQSFARRLYMWGDVMGMPQRKAA